MYENNISAYLIWTINRKHKIINVMNSTEKSNIIYIHYFI